jgi:2-haloacid dehalogenase
LSDADILGLYGELEAEAESSEYHPYRDILRSVVRGFGSRLGFLPTDPEQQSLPNSFAHWAPFPDTVAALRQLKTKFKLGIISNVDDDLFSATSRRLEIDFDYVITAGRARAYKPSLKIFELAQHRIGIPPEQWLHSAQSVYHDVIPARSLGISTVWVNRPSLRAGIGAVKQASAEADVTVTSMQALADLAV